MRLLIKSCSIIDAANEYPDICDIYIEGGIIKEIAPNIKSDGAPILDACGLTVMPGFIDMHAHLRQPGFERKETIKTGTMAAARGGYTTICCMPNTRPVIDSEDTIDALLQIIETDGIVNVLPIAAISKEQKGESLTDMVKLSAKGAIAFSDDGYPVTNSRLLREALKLARKEKLLLIEHCEEMSLAEGGGINEGKKALELNIKGIPGLSEELPVMRDILLAEETDSRIHIAHISTAKSADIVRNAKKRGIAATCEVTPHHIGLTEDIITEGFTDCKVNPPLRTQLDVWALKEALRDGTIDAIATDHAPHHIEDKGTDFYKAANGISGIETAFAVCYTELVQDGILTLRQLVEKMSYNPAKLLKLDKGTIQVGAVADLTIASLESSIVVDKESFLSKGKNTPFHGRRYNGKIIYTIVNGKIVYGKREEI